MINIILHRTFVPINVFDQLFFLKHPEIYVSCFGHYGGHLALYFSKGNFRGGGGLGNPCILGYRMCHFLGYFFGLKISLLKWKDSCELNFWAGFSCKNYILGYQIKSQNGTLPSVHRLTVPSPPFRDVNLMYPVSQKQYAKLIKHTLKLVKSINNI